MLYYLVVVTCCCRVLVSYEWFLHILSLSCSCGSCCSCCSLVCCLLFIFMFSCMVIQIPLHCSRRCCSTCTYLTYTSSSLLRPNICCRVFVKFMGTSRDHRL
ncbi:hypothetical protein BZA77DRAFT_310003 [Pyronema omphalodes]|nr:hypothetical protein BZA77DRAFT_310003 [Pyronema omphalodes]